MNDRDRHALLVRALAALRALRDASPLGARDKAQNIAEFGLMALVRVCNSETGQPLIADETIDRVFGALHRTREDWTVAIHRIDSALKRAAVIREHAPAAWVAHVARHGLALADPRLASVSDELLIAAVDASGLSKAASANIADMLKGTGALGTTRDEPRHALQRKIRSALRRPQDG